MHRNDNGGTRMRSCSSAERNAVLTIAVGIIPTPNVVVNRERTSDRVARHVDVVIEDLSAPPLTPPPRHV